MISSLLTMMVVVGHVPPPVPSEQFHFTVQSKMDAGNGWRAVLSLFTERGLHILAGTLRSASNLCWPRPSARTIVRAHVSRFFYTSGFFYTSLYSSFFISPPHHFACPCIIAGPNQDINHAGFPGCDGSKCSIDGEQISNIVQFAAP